MKPRDLIIAFDNEKQLDRILDWAYERDLDWSVPAKRPESRLAAARYATATFSRGGSHAIWVNPGGILYQSSLNYFKTTPRYNNCIFTHANKLPGMGIDCTIPEET